MSHEQPHPGRRRDSVTRWTGYTVMELVCALGIIAVFAAAGTPKFAKAICARRADAAARRVAADMEWLRSTARTTSTSQSMTFNTSASSYSLASFTNPDAPGTAYAVALADGTYKSQLVSVNVGGSGSVLTFNGYGLPVAAATIVVKSGTTSRTIAVDATTGAITWQ